MVAGDISPAMDNSAIGCYQGLRLIPNNESAPRFEERIFYREASLFSGGHVVFSARCSFPFLCLYIRFSGS